MRDGEARPLVLPVLGTLRVREFDVPGDADDPVTLHHVVSANNLYMEKNLVIFFS